MLDDGLVSELSILQTYRQDTGALTCRASNAYGQDEMLIHLVVQEVGNDDSHIKASLRKTFITYKNIFFPGSRNAKKHKDHRSTVSLHTNFVDATVRWQ